VGKGKKREAPPSFVETYKRVRKPMPPPERVIEDKRRRFRDRADRREIEEQASDRAGPAEGDPGRRGEG
jgi:hypothetical protein